MVQEMVDIVGGSTILTDYASVDDAQTVMGLIEKHKTTTVPLKYHKILRVEKKNIVSMLWIKDCPFPFPLKRPLPENASWAGVLYKQGIPWLLYGLAEEKQKDTWRKI